MSASSSSASNPNTWTEHIAALETRNRELEQQLQHCQVELQQLRKSRQATTVRSTTQADTILEQAIASITRFCILPNGDWFYDYCSPGCREVFGYTAQEFLQDLDLWRSRIPPEDWQTVIQPAHDLILAGQPQILRYRFFHKDGSLRWIAATLNSQWDPTTACWLVTSVDTDMTQYQQMEVSLRNSEEQLRQIADHISDAICLKSTQTGAVLYYNAAYETIHQRSREWINQNLGQWLEEIHPDDRDRITALAQQELQGNAFFNEEYRIIRPDGSIRWLSDRSFPIRNAAGEIYRFAMVQRDITEHKSAEQSLAEREAQFKLIIENIPQLIFLQSVESEEYLYISPGYERIWGRSCASLYQNPQSWQDAIHPEDYPTVAHSLAIQSQGEPVQRDYRVVRPDGSIRWVVADISLIHDSQGKPIRYVGVVNDITDRKHLELALQASETQLSAVLRRVGGIIVSLQLHPDGTWTYDYSSSGTEILYGYPPEELLNDPHLWRSRVFPEDLENQILPFFQRVLDGRTTPFQTEYRFWHRDGSLRWIAGTATAEWDSAIERWIVTVMEVDISDRKRAEIALTQQVQRVQTLNRVTQTIRQSLNLQTIFTTATTEIAKILDIELATITQYLPERQCWLRVAAYHLNSNFPETANLEIPDAHNPLAARLKRMEIVRVDQTDRIEDAVNLTLARAFPGAWLLVPLSIGGVVWGSFNVVIQARPEGWQDEQVELVQSIADQLAIAIQQAKLFQQVKQLNRTLQHQVQQRTSQLRMALAASRMGTWEWNLITNLKHWSPETFALFGLSVAPPTPPDHALILRLIHPEDVSRFEQSVAAAIEGRSLYECEFRVVWPDGTVVWIYERGACAYNAQGQPTRLEGVCMNITKRKQAEQQLRSSLMEKEVLLQEVHHRVKNNLQVVSSLLRMQSRQVDHEDIQALFTEAQNRVRSMALIHEQLYQSPNLSSISFDQYIRTLINHLFHSYGVNPEWIVPEIHTEGITLAITTAIPCGLIINELVSNALKYAFPHSRAGNIQIRLQKCLSSHHTNHCTIVLSIADNGIGIPATIQLETVQSLGLVLVTSLTHQLGGTLSLDRSQGTAFRITFPQTSPQE